ncbi:hypothetical protein AV530_012526 [Patagioenas fasciata monilis]|uniref:Uncharacterized protein n=1 Tax=Patagioenas fasciata monilis TaxID=372326 RepID=A0A1V4JBC2_PATFA|nr:hypothetical protein AV530_012526 [Patagioenas fasciata monilis]
MEKDVHLRNAVVLCRGYFKAQQEGIWALIYTKAKHPFGTCRFSIQENLKDLSPKICLDYRTPGNANIGKGPFKNGKVYTAKPSITCEGAIRLSFG